MSYKTELRPESLHPEKWSSTNSTRNEDAAASAGDAVLRVDAGSNGK